VRSKACTALTIDEEIKAVQIMHRALEQDPQSYPILHAQCDFLLSKGKTEWALQVAQQAVNSAPSEFVTWAKLTETYIELGRFDAALLTLNSCPMFTFNERDLHRMPTPAKTHLPVKKFVADSGILDEDSARDNEVCSRVELKLMLGRCRLAAATRARSERYIRQSVLAPHTPRIQDWMGRPLENAFDSVCDGGRVPATQDERVDRRDTRTCHSDLFYPHHPDLVRVYTNG
jgi:hypothetical protein